VPLIVAIFVDDDDNNVSNNWLCSLSTFPCQMKGKNPNAKI
jgi:hypothetical protein